MYAKRSCVYAPLLVLATAVAVRGAGTLQFQEARFEKGQLKYINRVPVLIVEGTPEEMGRQEAALIGPVAKSLVAYPRQLINLTGSGSTWDKCVAAAQVLVSHATQDHRDELHNLAAKAGVADDLLDVGNTIMDLHRGGYACSSLMVEPAKSRTGGVLFGRNLDFYTLGVLDRYGLVTVYRPQSKHAFATVGFPGLIGCISGMNDAGLAMAVHEVRFSADGAPMLNPKAMPYTFCFRQILEECTTIDEAEKRLVGSERSTMLSLAICDRAGAAVLEITPKNVVLRRGSDGICVNANHFRSDALAVSKISPRYDTLSRAAALKRVSVEDVFKKLDEVNQDSRTVQSMVFEPGPLILHVAMGKTPATKAPLETVELESLFHTNSAR